MNESIKERLRSLRDALMGLSLINLCFIRTRFGFFFDENHGYYKQFLLSKQALLAFAVNLVLLGFIAWRFARWVRRAQSRVLYRVTCVIVCALLLIPIDWLRTFYFHIRGSEAVAWGANPFLIAGLVLFLAAIWRWPRTVLHALAIVLMIFIPSAFLTFGRIAYYSLTARPDSQPRPPPMYHTAAPSVEPRVVWIIYDELDQRLAFTERRPDCPLPELDRVRAESLQATNAFPPGGSTLISLPALITGRYVIRARPVSRSELEITFANETAPVGWSTQSNVFTRARALGFNTALVGWYHPYSRLFASCLNFSAWYPYPSYQMSRAETFLRSLTTQIWSLVSAVQQRRIQIMLYRKSLENSRSLVKDGRYGLVLLHLPGPHYPGIYDPAKDAYTLTSFSRTRGYFQNLRLTDKTMGILRRDMEQAGQWDRSWVIISSDHWWRDANGYDGRLEHRVPFIVKAPGKNPPLSYSAPLNTVITHDLILAILRKQVLTTQDVVGWLDTHQPPPAPSYERMQTN